MLHQLTRWILVGFCIPMLAAQSKVKSVYFDFNQSVPTPYSTGQLDHLKDLYAQGVIQFNRIDSYTDSSGSVIYNDSLAARRLRFVMNYLNLKPDSSILCHIYGMNHPTAVKNYISWRRVDIFYTQSDLTEKQVQETVVEPVNYNLPQVFPSDSIAVIDTIQEITIHPDKLLILKMRFIETTTRLTPESYPEIDRLAAFLQENPVYSIRIRGHVCCSDNMKLSEKRARKVYLELKKRGISPKRMTYQGVSNQQPLVFPEITEKDRQMNRSVDVTFEKNQSY